VRPLKKTDSFVRADPLANKEKFSTTVQNHKKKSLPMRQNNAAINVIGDFVFLPVVFRQFNWGGSFQNFIEAAFH